MSVTAIVNDLTTGALVVKKAGLVSDLVTAALAISDAALGAGLTYRVTLVLPDGSEGTWHYTAA